VRKWCEENSIETSSSDGGMRRLEASSVWLPLPFGAPLGEGWGEGGKGMMAVPHAKLFPEREPDLFDSTMGERS